MTTQIYFYKPCTPYSVPLSDDRTILIEHQPIQGVELNWNNTKAYRVLTAIGLMGADDNIHDLPQMTVSNVLKACQDACDRCRHGEQWLAEFTVTEPGTAALVNALGCNVIDCSNNDLQYLTMNIVALRNACEKAIRLAGNEVVVQVC